MNIETTYRFPEVKMPVLCKDSPPSYDEVIHAYRRGYAEAHNGVSREEAGMLYSEVEGKQELTLREYMYKGYDAFPLA